MKSRPFLRQKSCFECLCVGLGGGGGGKAAVCLPFISVRGAVWNLLFLQLFPPPSGFFMISLESAGKEAQTIAVFLRRTTEAPFIFFTREAEKD
ncbi:MAG TPA: hypothetical protein PKM57_05630 [Kiritimatiellia bacterium]|nr:hypothetical protein [Kiritimatiellia bacterium]HPS09003.1 hypothetical protein [Kiritimatiellia bacterium]